MSNAQFQFLNKKVQMPKYGVMVERYNILSTKLFVHRVWVKLPAGTSMMDSNYSSFQRVDGVLYGDYNTYFNADMFSFLAVGSEERSDAIHNYFEQRYNESYALICAAFGEYCDSRNAWVHQNSGEITIYAEHITP